MPRLLALLACGLVAACSSEPAGPRRNVLLVVLDSVRTDGLSIHGAERPTPGVEALAAAGTTFDRAYATAPWTKPSMASMLTGLHPTSHGVTNTASVLDEDATTLPELFAAEGWTTAAVVSHHLIGRKFRFEQGFGSFDQGSARGHAFVSSDEVTRKAVDLLRDAAGSDRPFFLFVHYFDPHYDYRDHPGIPYAAPRAGRLDGSHGIGQLRHMVDSMTEEELAFLRDRYDEEILFTDAAVGRLLRRLEKLGLADETVVAFTVDHGEELGERGWIGHMQTLYEEVVRVPLVLAGPGVEAGRRVAEPVSLVDLAPTLLELAGLDPAGRGFEGRSLVPLLTGAEVEPERVFFEVDYLGVEVGIPGLKTTRKKGVLAGGWKLVRDDRTGELELYDLARDPGERDDLAASEPERAARLLAILEDHLAALEAGAPEAEETDFSAEELQDLRDLGYAGDE